jgi:hypothetical protein
MPKSWSKRRTREKSGHRLEHRLERTRIIDTSVRLELASEGGSVLGVESKAGPDASGHAFLLLLDGIDVALLLEDFAW